jgi:hypothetical protein
MGQLLEVLKGVTIPQRAKAVVAEADRLLAEWPEKAAYIEYLETEIQRLRVKSGEPTAGTGLTFDAGTGTYTSQDGNRYCARCLTKDDKRSPLTNERYGWACPVCGKHYFDPSRPLPTVVTKRVRGGRI